MVVWLNGAPPSALLRQPSCSYFRCSNPTLRSEERGAEGPDAPLQGFQRWTFQLEVSRKTEDVLQTLLQVTGGAAAAGVPASFWPQECFAASQGLVSGEAGRPGCHGESDHRPRTNGNKAQGEG